jgi:hypothetical protein
MSEKYYTSFFVPTGGGGVRFEYDGVVEVAQENFDATLTTGAGLFARLVARNLEVPEGEVRVLEWERLH